MSNQELINSAEKLLLTTNDSFLKEILKDYILEKKFLEIIPSLSDNHNLKKICKDFDDWQKQFAIWTPSITYSSFDKAELDYLPDSNDDLISIRLSTESYHCGSWDREERYLYIQKEWLLVDNDEKPWIDYLKQTLVSKTKERFETLTKDLLSGQTLQWCYTLVGVTENFFDLEMGVIMNKINRFQNVNYFLSQAQSNKIKELYPTLINYEIILDPKDKEFGFTTLLTYLISLDGFNPLEINKIIQKIQTEQEKAEKKEKIKSKTKEMKLLEKKYSQKELDEMEKLIKLKKELK